MEVKVLAEAVFGAFAFVVEGLSDSELPPLGRFVGLTVSYCTISAIVFEEVVMSFRHAIDNGLFFGKVEAV